MNKNIAEHKSDGGRQRLAIRRWRLAHLWIQNSSQLPGFEPFTNLNLPMSMLKAVFSSFCTASKQWHWLSSWTLMGVTHWQWECMTFYNPEPFQGLNFRFDTTHRIAGKWRVDCYLAAPDPIQNENCCKTWPTIRICVRSAGVKTLSTNFFPVTNAVWPSKVKIISFCTMLESPGYLHNTGSLYNWFTFSIWSSSAVWLAPPRCWSELMEYFTHHYYNITPFHTRPMPVIYQTAPSISMEWIHFFAFSVKALCSPGPG